MEKEFDINFSEDEEITAQSPESSEELAETEEQVEVVFEEEINEENNEDNNFEDDIIDDAALEDVDVIVEEEVAPEEEITAVDEPEDVVADIEQVPEQEVEIQVEKKSVPEKKITATEIKTNKRVLLGKVVSNKADKTVILKVERQVAHPLYKKYYKRSNKFMAHDENNECNIGDTIRVRECRPLSKRKRWTLVEIVERAK